jgi:hypothetical protein
MISHIHEHVRALKQQENQNIIQSRKTKSKWWRWWKLKINWSSQISENDEMKAKGIHKCLEYYFHIAIKNKRAKRIELCNICV